MPRPYFHTFALFLHTQHADDFLADFGTIGAHGFDKNDIHTNATECVAVVAAVPIDSAFGTREFAAEQPPHTRASGVVDGDGGCKTVVRQTVVDGQQVAEAVVVGRESFVF